MKFPEPPKLPQGSSILFLSEGQQALFSWITESRARLEAGMYEMEVDVGYPRNRDRSRASCATAASLPSGMSHRFHPREGISDRIMPFTVAITGYPMR